MNIVCIHLFGMVPVNITYQHCVQLFFFEIISDLYQYVPVSMCLTLQTISTIISKITIVEATPPK